MMLTIQMAVILATGGILGFSNWVYLALNEETITNSIYHSDLEVPVEI